MRKAPAHTNSIGSRTNTTKRMRKAPVHKNGTGSHTHTHAIKRMRKAPANAERANLLPHKRQTATEVLDCQYIAENWQAHRGFWAVCPTSFLTSFQCDHHGGIMLPCGRHDELSLILIFKWLMLLSLFIHSGGNWNVITLLTLSYYYFYIQRGLFTFNTGRAYKVQNV